MTTTLIHPQRAAFDAARVIVRAATHPVWAGWLADQLGVLAGPTYRQYLIDSRARLLTDRRPDTPDGQAGLWRVRLTELLQTRPELTERLHTLTVGTADRLATWR